MVPMGRALDPRQRYPENLVRFFLQVDELGRQVEFPLQFRGIALQLFYLSVLGIRGRFATGFLWLKPFDALTLQLSAPLRQVRAVQSLPA